MTFSCLLLFEYYLRYFVICRLWVHYTQSRWNAVCAFFSLNTDHVSQTEIFTYFYIRRSFRVSSSLFDFTWVQINFLLQPSGRCFSRTSPSRSSSWEISSRLLSSETSSTLLPTEVSYFQLCCDFLYIEQFSRWKKQKRLMWTSRWELCHTVLQMQNALSSREEPRHVRPIGCTFFSSSVREGASLLGLSAWNISACEQVFFSGAQAYWWVRTEEQAWGPAREVHSGQDP